jgi:hypothetical protein
MLHDCVTRNLYFFLLDRYCGCFSVVMMYSDHVVLSSVSRLANISCRTLIAAAAVVVFFLRLHVCLPILHVVAPHLL